MYSRIIPGRLDRRGSVRRGGFNGNFATLFPGAYQVLQSDRGLTYGGTPLANAGNTSTTVITLTGSLATAPVPLWVVATNTLAVGAGAAFDIYADGLGVTPLMSSVAPAAGFPIPLTGAGLGLSLAWSAGASVSGDGWKATCAGLADQTANGKNSTQVTAARQPVITAGYNGKPGLLFTSANQNWMISSVGSLLSFPYTILVVAGITASNVNANSLVGGDSFAGMIYQAGAAGTYYQYNSTLVNAVALGVTTAQQRWSATYTNTTADSLKIGNVATSTGANAGSFTGTNRTIGSSGTVPGQFLDGEVLAVIYLPGGTSYAAFDAVINSSAGYGPGAIGV